MAFSHCESGESGGGVSIRSRVVVLLERNPLLTAKVLCRLMGLGYVRHGGYVANVRSAWRSHCKNERGSKCSLHGWRGWCFAPVGVDRGRAVGAGWLETCSRNRWLLWRDRLGRLQWFETGRVNVFVRRPANLGKAYQLVCNGFSFTGLLTDVKVLEEMLRGIRFKGAHFVFPVGQRLPKLTVDLFSKSNGVVIKVGDDSHPDGLEVIASYPDWAERNERLLEQLHDVLQHVLDTRSDGVPNHVLNRQPVGIT